MNTTPIEFMAWDKREQELFYVSRLDFDCGIATIMCGKSYCNSDLDFDWHGPSELLQLTALRSISDEPIYNHMIVKSKAQNYFVVDMFNYVKMYGLSIMELEIVGNRFQNPELLELCK